MNPSEIINNAKEIYGILHQSDEMHNCLSFLQDKSLIGFIEIGSANGASFHCWASIIQLGPKISVDLNHGFGLSAGLPDANTSKNTLAAGEGEYTGVKNRNDNWRLHFTDVRIVEGNSMAIETIETTRKTLNGEKVGWLFIDAWHEYFAVKRDLENYKQFVNPTGYIGFHDIHQSTSMTNFWNEVQTIYPTTYEITGGTGIGIIKNEMI
jgi:cephalosporin hydroxylase